MKSFSPILCKRDILETYRTSYVASRNVQAVLVPRPTRCRSRWKSIPILAEQRATMVASLQRIACATLPLALLFFGSYVGAKHDEAIAKVQKQFPKFVPRAMLDIGANEGVWTREFHKRYPSTKILMLEASPQHNASLTKVVNDLGHDKAEFHINVMSGTAGETVEFFQGGNTGNSMFRENTKFYANEKPVQRITSTVDTEVSQSFIKDVPIDLIKIDVQGAELLVLEGASKALRQATFVQFEASLVNYNPGGACYFDVDQFLREHGYFIHDFGGLMYNPRLFKTNGIGQFDILYVNSRSQLLPDSMRNNPSLYCGQESVANVTTTGRPSEKSNGEAREGWDETVKAVEGVLDPATKFGEELLKGRIKSKLRRRTVIMLVIGYIIGSAVTFVFLQAATKLRNKTL